MTKAVKDWYRGPFVPHQNDVNSNFVIFGGRHEPHWTARVVSVLVEFWLNHWKWLIGIALGIAALIWKK